MAQDDQRNYGASANFVRIAGNLMAAVGAIYLSFRGRYYWEPSEQDISGAPQRVAFLLTAVIIVIAWNSSNRKRLKKAMIGLAVGCLVFLLGYGYLTGTQTYERLSSTGESQIVGEEIIGGFWLTPDAKAAITKYDTTVQDLLKGAGYDPDRIWSRPSRELAKISFVIGYVGLIVCGTGALACAAELTRRKPKPGKRSSQKDTGP